MDIKEGGGGRGEGGGSEGGREGGREDDYFTYYNRYVQ